MNYKKLSSKLTDETWENLRQIHQDCQDAGLETQQIKKYERDEINNHNPRNTFMNRLDASLAISTFTFGTAALITPLIFFNQYFENQLQNGNYAPTLAYFASAIALSGPTIKTANKFLREHFFNQFSSSRPFIEDVRKSAQTQRYILGREPKPHFIKSEEDLERYAPGNL